jgi:hypothetical protein
MSYYSTRELKKRVLHQYLCAGENLSEQGHLCKTAPRTDCEGDSEAYFSNKENRLVESWVQCELLRDPPRPQKTSRPSHKKPRRPEGLESLTVRKAGQSQSRSHPQPQAQAQAQAQAQEKGKVLIVGKDIIGSAARSKALRINSLLSSQKCVPCPRAGPRRKERYRPDRKRVESTTSRKTACSSALAA